TSAAAASARSACAARVAESASPNAAGPVRAPSSAKKIVPITATPSALPSCWAVTSVPEAAPAAVGGTVRSTRVIRGRTARPHPRPGRDRGEDQRHRDRRGLQTLDDDERREQAERGDDGADLRQVVARSLAEPGSAERAGDERHRERREDQARVDRAQAEALL